MPNYRRFRDGDVFFFTLVTHRRRDIFSEASARGLLRTAIEATRAAHPWTTEGIVLLPDHMHMLWRMPADDGNYARRIAAFKKRFTRAYLSAGGVEGELSASQRRQRCRWP